MEASWSCPAPIALHPDLVARRLLVCAYLYYVLDASPLMPDCDYDAQSVYVAEHWYDLDPVRQWQLGDPGSTRATGAHFKFTAYTVGGARHAYWKRYGKCAPGELPAESDWKLDGPNGLRYVTA